MKHSLPVKDTVIIGFMLFALFFGAGNMIYPPELGQAAASALRWVTPLLLTALTTTTPKTIEASASIVL
ncbi:hypothetical protein BBP18_13380 [Bacillus velezensis]|nr:hypothetical protein BBP18_13380 [Bacillus velezensis]